MPNWLDFGGEHPINDLTHIGETEDLTAYASHDDYGGELEDGWVRVNDNLAVRE